MEEYFAAIESLEFITQFTVLSGFNSVRRALEENETIQQLIDTMKNSSGASSSVYEHTQSLLREIDTVKEIDEPLTAYLYVLGQVDIALMQRAAGPVVINSRLFRARQMAEYLLALPQSASEHAS